MTFVAFENIIFKSKKCYNEIKHYVLTVESHMTCFNQADVINKF